MDWKVIQGDCLQVMAGMAYNEFDIIITDPPYGIGEAAGKNKSRSKMAVSRDYGDQDWDNQRPNIAYFTEMRRVSKQQIVFGGNYFADMLPPSSCWIVWDKDNGATDFADCELAWTSFSSAVRKIKWRWHGMLQENMAAKDERVHPTQKPVGVMEWIIAKYTNPGQRILDPFAGSGTTGVAAIQTGRRFIGIEKDAAYCDMARKRIGNAMPLFA